MLADLDISHCAHCGKLFQAEPGKKYCRDCLAWQEKPDSLDQPQSSLPESVDDSAPVSDDLSAQRIAEEVARFTGLSPDEVVETQN